MTYYASHDLLRVSSFTSSRAVRLVRATATRNCSPLRIAHCVRVRIRVVAPRAVIHPFCVSVHMPPRPDRLIPKASVNATSVADGAEVGELQSPWYALNASCSSAASRDVIAIVDVVYGDDRGIEPSVVEYSAGAILFEAKTLAYELERSYGVTKGSNVILMLENSAAYIVAMHACAGLGAHCAHANPASTASEFQSALAAISTTSTASPRVIIANDAFANVIGDALYAQYHIASIANDDTSLDDVSFAPPAVMYHRSGALSVTSSLPSYDRPDVRAFMHHHVACSRFALDLTVSACGDDYVVTGDSSDLDADEDPLRLLARGGGDALRWRPSMTNHQLLECDFQCMFTSGTTGKCKLITHTQRQVALHARSFAEYCEFKPFEDVALHVAPMHHAMGASATHPCVLVGGVKQVIIITPHGHFDARATLETIAAHGVTFTQLAPTHLSMTLADVAAFAGHCAPTLRMVSCGGSCVPAHLIRAFTRACPRAVFFVDYGCTEACGKMCSTLRRVANVDAGAEEDVESHSRAGWSMPLFDVAVVKDLSSMQSVAFDDAESGEVIVRGPTVVRDPDDFDVDVDEWHRTGDVAAVNPKGSLRIVDRVKDVIHVGGETVYGSEVERVVLEHPDVVECAVFAAPDALMGEIPRCAVVVRDVSPRVDAQTLIDFIAARLARFKVPHHIVFVDALPKTSLGKVIKSKLRLDSGSGSGVGAPRNSEDIARGVDRALRDATGWADDVIIDADAPLIGALGMRSTHAVAFARALGERFHIDVPTTVVFDRFCARGVAEFIQAATMTTMSVVDQPPMTIHARARPGHVAVIRISMSCPGRVDDFESYIRRAGDAAQTLDGRFDVECPTTTAMTTSIPVRFASRIMPMDVDDIVANELAPSEAAYVDPQHRLTLRHALSMSPGPSSGVFIGCMWNDDYATTLAACPCVLAAPSASIGLGSGLAFLTGRVAFVVNAAGPAVGVDTACSSSLVACALGIDAIHGTSHTTQAVCGGVNALISARTMGTIYRLGALSPDGRCKTLDVGADGYGRAEACAQCLLDKCDTESSTHITRVCMNQDARSSALTAPRGSAQSACVTEAMTADVEPHSAPRQYTLHGTGTPLGDPLEFSALFEALDAHVNAMTVMSVKSTLGHGEGAAGIVGALAALASVAERRDVHISHLVALNQYIRDVPARAAMPRQPAGCALTSSSGDASVVVARVAGVSAFGMSGTNAVGAVKSSSSSSVVSALALPRRRFLFDAAHWCSVPPPSHAFIHRYVETTFSGIVTFRARVDARRHRLDYRLAGAPAFGAAAFADIAHGVAVSKLLLSSTDACVRHMCVHAVLFLRATGVSEFDVGVSARLGAVSARTSDGVKRMSCDVRQMRHVMSSNTASGGSRRTPTPTTACEPSRRPRLCAARARDSCPNADAGHVALVDAAMQLGAFMISTTTMTEARVPISFETVYQQRHSSCMGDSAALAAKALNRVVAAGFASATHVATTSMLSSRLRQRQHQGGSKSKHMIYEHQRVALCALSSSSWSKVSSSSVARLRLQERRSASSPALVAAALNVVQCSTCDGAFPACITFETMTEGAREGGLRAMARTVALEHRPLRRRVCSYSVSSNTSRGDVGGAILDDASLHEFDVCARVVCEPRLVRGTVTGRRCDPRGRVLVIFGGVGGVGLETARRANADTVVLLASRRGRSLELNPSTLCVASVSICSCDVASIDQVKDCLSYVSCAAASPNVDVAHASGALRDNMLQFQRASSVSTVFAMKTAGFSSLMHPCATSLRPCAVLACSSIASTLGSAGQANYAAANGVVDTLALEKRAQGLVVSSAQFGAWSRVGMTSRASSVIHRAERLGLGSIDPEDGVRVVFDILRACEPGASVVVVCPFDVRVVSKYFPADLTTMFNTFAGVSQAPSSTSSLAFAGQHGVGKDDIRARVASAVRAVINTSSISSTSIDVDAPLVASGLDSLAANELKIELDGAFGFHTPATLAYDFPTIRTLSEYIASQLAPSSSAPQTHSSMSSLSLSSSHMPSGALAEITNTNLACAGSSSAIAASSTDVDGASRAPRSRWNHDFVIDTDAVRAFIPYFAGFVDHSVTLFDAEVFGIPPVEALIMCPQMRGVLEGALIVGNGNAARDVGVYVGVTQSNYKSDIVHAFWGQFHQTMGTGSLPSVAAGRVNFMFDYAGPSLAIDTACSSSLVAVSFAFDALRANVVSYALMCGTHLMVSANGAVDRRVANLLSMDGRCKTFDADADGFAQSEACGVVGARVAMRHGRNRRRNDVGAVDRRLQSRGESSHDMLIAIVGNSVNQDGRSSALTAPNGPAQQAALRIALLVASRDGFEDGVSTHGTGTALGDPIEVGAIVAVASDMSAHGVVLEATKSQCGHSETAAGVVALAKTVRVLARRRRDAVVHLRRVNHHVSSITTWRRTSAMVSIPRQSTHYLRHHETQSRTASCGISAFAFQGTNAHVVVVAAAAAVVNAATSSTTPTSVLLSKSRFWPLPNVYPHVQAFKAFTKDDVSTMKTTFVGTVHPRDDAHMLDHIVNGSAIYPGAGYQELAAAIPKILVNGNDNGGAVISNSMIPAPMVMSTESRTLVDVVVFGARAVVVKSTTNSATHMRCGIQRTYVVRQHTTLVCPRLAMADRRASACARIPRRDEHLSYDVHPAALDCALQLAAAIDNARNDGVVKVPVGVRAYKSSSLSSSSSAALSLMVAALRGVNHTLEDVNVADVEVKIMASRSTGANKRRKSSNRHFMYEVGEFAVRSTHRVGRCQGVYTMASALADDFDAARTRRDSACALISVWQSANARVSSVSLQTTSRSASEDAVRAIIRSISQEAPLVAFASTRLGVEDFAFVDDSVRSAFVKGAAYECDAITLMMREHRLRLASPSKAPCLRRNYAPSIVKAKLRSGFGFGFHSDADSAILITGGLGAVGLEVTRACERRGMRVEITSRTGRAMNFAHRTGDVRAFKCDDRLSLRASDAVFPRGAPIRIVHAAGTIRDALVHNQSVYTVCDVIASKSLASIHDGAAPASHPLASTMLCSSIAALTGNPGQTNYAYANALLDANARRHRREGEPFASAQFGGWSDIGMAARDVSIARRLERIGAGALTPEEGISVILKVVFHGAYQVRDFVVSPFQWSRVAASALPAFYVFGDVIAASEEDTRRRIESSTSRATDAGATNISSTTAEDVTRKVESIVQSLVGNRVPNDAPLMDAGLDSQAANELKTELDAAFGLDVPATAAYDFPTISALSAYVASRIAPAPMTSTITFGTTGLAASGDADYMNIVADIVGADLLVPVHSGDGVSRVPSHRWDNQWYVESVALLIPSFSAFVSAYDVFDDDVFSLARAEALLMDVQQRSILEGVLACRLGASRGPLVEDGLDAALDGVVASTGVYVAISAMQYQNEVLDRYWPNQTSPYIATGNTLSVAAGRVSYIFGLRGPCASMDTACSSSIVATHFTMEGLRHRDCTSAVIAGVISILGPGVSAIFFSSGMLSQSGRCKTLDAEADGYVRGEARGVFVVDAADSADESHALRAGVAIIGSSMNQDGRSSSLTAPHGPSQSVSLRLALRAARVCGTDVDKLQMHGTGTPLGDPIEVGATMTVLAACVRSRDDAGGVFPLTLEAHKSHIGHTETASGMVALAQPLATLASGVVETILHLRAMNPHIATIARTSALRREASTPRQRAARVASHAGVSSFAFQGTNANAIQRVIRHSKRVPRARPMLRRQRFWPLPSLHPHVHCFRNLDNFAAQRGRRDELRMLVRVDGRLHAHVLDHRVLDAALYPGAGFQEIASAVARIFGASRDDFAVVHSTVAVPLHMRAKMNIEFEASAFPENGETRIRSAGATTTYMRCSTRRILNDVDFSASAHRHCYHATMLPSRSREPPMMACAKIASPESHAYLDYWIHPACLDNALQCGAVMSAGSPSSSPSSDDVKVPVGVDAYAARAIPTHARMLYASASPSHYLLHNSAAVVGLRVKSMRRGAQKMASNSGERSMAYTVKWFAVNTNLVETYDQDATTPALALSSRRRRGGSSASCSRAFSAALATSHVAPKPLLHAFNAQSLAQSLTPDVLGDGLHGLNRTAAQEFRHAEVTGTRTSANLAKRRRADVLAGSSPVAPGVSSTHVAGDAHETLEIGGTTYERRLRPLATSVRDDMNMCARRSSSSMFARVKSHVMHGNDIDAPARVTLISGGLGAIGMEYARYVDGRRSRVHALSRAGRSREFDGFGFNHVIAHKCDASHANDILSVSWRDIDDVVHAAGVLRDALMRKQNAHSMFAVVGSKVDSWTKMRSRLAQCAPHKIVLCSSISALSGSVGQANYTAANATLDGDALAARRLGNSQSSMAWGAWLNAGMADASVLSRVDAMGFGIVTPERGMRALERVMSRVDVANVVATPFDFVKLARAMATSAPRIYTGMLPKITATSKTRRVAVGRTKGTGARRQHSIGDIRTKVAAIVSGIVGRDVSEDEPLMDAGLDSIGGAELQKNIEDEFSIELPATAAFDYPTVSALSDFVASQIGDGDGGDEDEYVGGGAGAARSRLSIDDVRQRVLAIASGVIGREIGTSEPLVDAGIDSLSGQEMKSQVEDEFGIELPATAAFDYPTVDALSDYVASEIGARTSSVAAMTTISHAIAAAAAQKSVVARAYSLRAPQPPDADGIRRVPLHRWDMDRYQQGIQEYMLSRVTGYNLHIPCFGGFLARYEYFDAKVFSISSLEALYMDVQQRSLLEGVARAMFKSEGIGNDALESTPTSLPSGVYVGIASCDYADELLRAYVPVLHPFLVSGTSLNVAAGRISYTFNFRGPSMSVDTACSSSLVTTHLSFIALRCGETSSAVSCGVQALLSAHITGVFHSSGMLADDGRCKTLDADADGYVRGEARGVLALEAVGAAAMGKICDVVIAGTAVNQDGRSSALTAPNGPSQKVVMREALTLAAVTGAAIDKLHMHGTGTPLGDPIEFGAALPVLERVDPTQPAPAFEASKSAVGHTETAAGIIAILASIASLPQSTVNRIMHLKFLNPHCQSLAAAAKTNGTSAPRQSFGRAASLAQASGFAFQGTNANAVARVSLTNARTSHTGRELLFHRERFYPLPHLFPHLHTFNGLDDFGALTRFGALVDTRVHGHMLDNYRVFPVGALLELANATMRIMEITEHALRDVHVFTPLVLFTKSNTEFEVCVSNAGGNVVVQSNGGQDVHMTCAFDRFLNNCARDATVRGGLWGLAEPSRDDVVRARVRPSERHEHFEYNVNPMCVESALTLRAALERSSEAHFVCASCVRYSTPEHASTASHGLAEATARKSAYAIRSTTMHAPMFRPLRSATSRAVVESARAAGIPKTRRRIPPAKTMDEIQGGVRRMCATIVGTLVEPDAPLTDCGIDSLGAAELRSAIQHEFAVVLPVTVAFECPTTNALGAFVHKELSAARAEAIKQSSDRERHTRARKRIVATSWRSIAETIYDTLTLRDVVVAVLAYLVYVTLARIESL